MYISHTHTHAHAHTHTHRVKKERKKETMDLRERKTKIYMEGQEGRKGGRGNDVIRF